MSWRVLPPTKFKSMKQFSLSFSLSLYLLEHAKLLFLILKGFSSLRGNYTIFSLLNSIVDEKIKSNQTISSQTGWKTKFYTNL